MLRFALGRRRAGDTAKLTVQRKDSKLTFLAELTEPPKAAPKKDKLPTLPGEKPKKEDSR